MLKQAITACGFIVATSTSASADSWQEREALGALVREVRALQMLLEAAHRARDDEARVQFDYPQLSLDLETIESGIAQYLNQPIDPVLSAVHQDIEGAYTNTYRELPMEGDVRVQSDIAITTKAHCAVEASNC